MGGIIIALASLCVAAAIQRVFLAGRAARLRAREQAFEFHSLRDDLQLLVAENRLETSSLTYIFLMDLLNFAIRNAGVAKLSELLLLAKRIEKHIGQARVDVVFADIQAHGPAVQELAQGFFFAFAHMLVSNDWLVRWGVGARSAVTASWEFVRPAVRVLDVVAAALFGVVTPTRAAAVKEASRYRAWGRRLYPCG